MAIKLSGLISGMDTDTLVKELVSAYSVKKDNYVKQQTKLEWKMDAWKALNTKVYGFYTGKLSAMRFSTNFNKKAVKVSDDTKATITASSTAVNGDQTLEITKLAKTGYLTGAELKDADGKHYKSNAKLGTISGFTDGAITVTVDGKEKTINATSDMTISKFVSKLKEAGLTASYDENNGRFFLSAPSSGADHDFTLTGANSGGMEVLKSLGLNAEPTAAEISKYEEIAAWTADDIKKMAANDYLAAKVSEANATYTEKNKELAEDTKELNSKITYANLSSEKKAEAYKKAKEKYDELSAKPEDELTDAEKTSKESYEKTLALYDEVNAELGITVSTSTDAEGKTVYTVSDADEAVKESVVQGYKDAVEANNEAVKANNEAVKANNELLKTKYDDITTVSFTKYTETEGADGTHNEALSVDASYTSETSYTDSVAAYEKTKADAADIVASAGTSNTTSTGAVRIAGENASIVLNGATFESSTNNFSINGLTITATGLTEEDEPITVTTSTDVDAVYDMVKDFITDYNTLIKEMDTLYSAASSKGYEPLTDDEKEAMSDTEVEKWEKKIKDSLLRRDSTLQSVTNVMKNMMSQAYEIDGKNYSLSSFGIKTLGYFSSGDNEKGVYHIDGDSKDDQVSGNEDKLKAAIANDPENFQTFFSKLANGVYDSLTKKMASSSLSSAYTLYNDKEMQRKYNDYDDTIEKWEDKVAAIEDRYYEQFAAMESALAELQASTSGISSLLGV